MTENLILFNYVALPVDTNYIEQLTSFAQKNYRLTAIDYLLGPDSLPHMTLCFFHAESIEAARHIGLTMPCFPDNNMIVATNTVYYRPHVEGSFFSTGFLVHKTQKLQDYQTQVHAHITKAGGIAQTSTGDDYWPHITCAFTSVASAIQTTDILPWATGKIPVRLGLGISDKAGQFLKEIKLEQSI